MSWQVVIKELKFNGKVLLTLGAAVGGLQPLAPHLDLPALQHMPHQPGQAVAGDRCRVGLPLAILLRCTWPKHAVVCVPAHQLQ